MSDIHAAVGSYAVDALTPVERAEFEAHLDGCPSCRWEAAEFGETLAQLSALTAAAPPAALRESVLSAVAGIRQVGSARGQRSPGDAAPVDDQAPEAEPAPRRALAPVTELRPLEPHEVVPLEEHPSQVPDEPWLGMAAVLSEDMGRLSRWQERVLGAVVAVALIVALVLGGWVFVSRQQIHTLEARAQQQTELLNAQDARIYRDNVDGTPVSFVVSKERNEVLFVGNDLAAPESGSVYQLWIVKGPASASAGVVRGGDIRELYRNGQVQSADRLVVTLEPGPRGSGKPSGLELAQVDLSS
jgi:Anti-sigma-K factor rskA/Putative zinc-finger